MSEPLTAIRAFIEQQLGLATLSDPDHWQSARPLLNDAVVALQELDPARALTGPGLRENATQTERDLPPDHPARSSWGQAALDEIDRLRALTGPGERDIRREVWTAEDAHDDPAREDELPAAPSDIDDPEAHHPSCCGSCDECIRVCWGDHGPDRRAVPSEECPICGGAEPHVVIGAAVSPDHRWPEPPR